MELRSAIRTLSAALSLLVCLLTVAAQAATTTLDLSKTQALSETAVPAEPKTEKVLLYFWGTWCSDCKSKLGHELVDLSKRPGVTLVTVNTDSDIERARHFVEKEKITLPVAGDVDKSLRKEFKVFSVPHWVVLKRSGSAWEIAQSQSGSDLDALTKALQ